MTSSSWGIKRLSVHPQLRQLQFCTRQTSSQVSVYNFFFLVLAGSPVRLFSDVDHAYLSTDPTLVIQSAEGGSQILVSYHLGTSTAYDVARCSRCSSSFLTNHEWHSTSTLKCWRTSNKWTALRGTRSRRCRFQIRVYRWGYPNNGGMGPPMTPVSTIPRLRLESMASCELLLIYHRWMFINHLISLLLLLFRTVLHLLLCRNQMIMGQGMWKLQLTAAHLVRNLRTSPLLNHSRNNVLGQFLPMDTIYHI